MVWKSPCTYIKHIIRQGKRNKIRMYFIIEEMNFHKIFLGLININLENKYLTE